MSWHFSRALVEDCLPANYSDGERSALLNWMNIADAFLHSDRMSATLDIRSQYGMTFVPLTADRGAGELICYLAVFLARHSAPQREGETMRPTSGPKCAA